MTDGTTETSSGIIGDEGDSCTGIVLDTDKCFTKLEVFMNSGGSLVQAISYEDSAGGSG